MRKSEQLDKILVEGLIFGDYKAFTSLYHRYKNIIYNFILKLSKGDGYLAEEIVQETFIKLWEVRKNVLPDYPVRKYLQVISKNLFLKAVSQRISEELIESKIAEKNIKGENDVEETVELKFLLEEIERIISLLSPAKQNVYRMKHEEYLTQKEIAEKLNITENTVETHLKQSAKILQMKLKNYFSRAGTLLSIFLYFLLLNKINI